MPRRARIVLAMLFVFASGASPARAQQLRGLDEYVNRAMAEWEVPGLGLAIVHRDSVVYAKGFGVRELGSSARVDEHTMFAIGSSSKAFTALLLAALIDDGAAKWDDRVIEHLPWFQVFDPYVTREMTLRDVLSHRSGLSRGDLLWYGSDMSREDVVRRVRWLEPSWSFRSQFGYQNIMYLTAGEVVEELSGSTWDELVRERIFAPLGMRTSSTTVDALASMDNVATPHTRVEERVTPVAWRDIDNAGPAGSINSNVREMAAWVRLQLGRGEYDGRRIVSEANHREMWSPHTIIQIDTASERLYPETHFRTYGLGWFMEDYRGRRLVHHGGNIDGMSALVAMMPEHDVGLVILTNMNGSGLPATLMRRIFDLYIDGPGRDWSAEVLAFTKQRMEQAEARQASRDSARVRDTSPSLALERYAGTYDSRLYGQFVVSFEDGGLRATYGPAFDGTLEHWHYNTFRANWEDPQLGTTMLTFTLNARGEPGTLDVEGMGEFNRQADSSTQAAGGIR
ncbi:MAG TPA: serine hydrolase [Longimicrobiales bacterium]|nr:serine hydrolase [Longimicrobiales bacterium]